ncbi:insulinase family protein [Streptomyces bauhiniae]|uniref:Insulinase family protein n=1 Tax=Streptomyces bauhiniae TaxID=2340725 RepID=A0A4Z1CX08_9ACTN|nr:insulinase family protein [Streptomyces bauhiniae]TGN73692.1 insulinase family protein [Streptomyces bauhiniae]
MNPHAAVHHTRVDGIPTLFVQAAGPMRAGLVFRVGIADETLGRAGLTHLIEHLALYRQGVADYHYNGATKAAFTHFHVEGAEHEIAAYLTGVCASLTDLPMDRLETEKEILRTEESRRDSGLLPLWRYGAQGYGLVSYPEWGVRNASAQDVWQWAQSWFTADNAVLWIAGEHIPAGLSLKLPAGDRRPMPAVTSALPTTPAYFSDGTGGVLLDAVVADTTAAWLYSGVLERELTRALRQEGGYSYTAASDFTSRRDGHALVTAFADSLPAKQDAVLGGFVDVLAGFQAGRIAQADLDAVRGRADGALAAPDTAARRLPGLAEDLLAGRPLRTADELRAELRAVTPADLHQVALEAAGTALLQVPGGHSADWAGYTAAPVDSPYAVTGRCFPARDGDDTALVMGADGVSLTGRTANGSERAVTVHYRACAAVLSWPDGGRRLVGTDGLTVEVEPGLYGIDAHTMAALDAAVPPHAVVHLPPRQQPQPAARRPEPVATASGAAPARRTWGQRIGIFLLLSLTALLAFVALAWTVGGAGDPETGAGEYTILTCVLWAAVAGVGWPAVSMLRRPRTG